MRLNGKRPLAVYLLLNQFLTDVKQLWWSRASSEPLRMGSSCSSKAFLDSVHGC